MDAKKFKNIALGSMTSLLLLVGQSAFAHNTIRDFVPEGKTVFNALLINHGCAPFAPGGEGTPNPVPQIPVIGFSALFPNNADSVWTILNADGTPKGPTTLAATMDGVAPVLVIAPKEIQSKDVFQNCHSIVDQGVLIGRFNSPNIRGIKCTNGNLETVATGEVPMSLSGPAFNKNSCAKSLQVRVAMVNWCKDTSDATDASRADVWIGHLTSKFNDGNIMPSATFATTPYWPTLTITRDLTKNPLPAGCDPATGYDVAVEPSDADIDNLLPQKGYWPKNAAASQ